MSRMVVSQKVEYTCEGCGKKEVFEIVDAPLETAVAMGQWYNLTHRVVAPGQLMQLQADACSLPCVPAAATKILLPPEEPQTDHIDLNSLRAENSPLSN